LINIKFQILYEFERLAEFNLAEKLEAGLKSKGEAILKVAKKPAIDCEGGQYISYPFLSHIIK